MTTRRKRAWFAGLLLGVTAVSFLAWSGLTDRVYQDLPGPIMGPLEPLPTIGSLSSEQCKVCHATLFEEWAGSAHGRAVTDKLYQADLKLQGEPYFCDYCHAPLVEQRPTVVTGIASISPNFSPITEPNPRFQPHLHREGIGCVVCHQQGGAMVGPLADSKAPHPTKTSSDLRGPQACAPCHQLDFKFVGSLERPIADTVNEWREYIKAGGTQDCVGCHMPSTEPRTAGLGGPERPGTNHALRGPFDAEFVRSGLGVMIEWQQDGSAVAELKNLSGHRFPTADPHRRLEVSLEILDKDNQILDKTVHRIERLVDAHSLEEHPGQDNTLLPGETRRIAMARPISRDPAAGVRIRLDFVLWDPGHPVAIAADMSDKVLVYELFTETAPANH